MFNEFRSGQRLSASDLTTAFDETLWTKQQEADEQVTSNTVLTASTYLRFPDLPANSEWSLSSEIFYTSDSTADFKVSFTTSNGTDTLRLSNWGAATGDTGADDTIDHSATDAFQTVTFTEPGNGTGTLMTLRPGGAIVVSSSDTTLRVTFAQNATNANATTLRRGSVVRLTRVG